jgi:hypothetical protein
MPFISKTPKPPYYAVVFTSIDADVECHLHRNNRLLILRSPP